MEELSFWQTLISGAVGAVAVPAILYLWGIFLRRENVKRWGARIGRFASKFLNQKLGVRGGERVQDRIESSLEDLVTGIVEGMNEDDRCAAD